MKYIGVFVSLLLLAGCERSASPTAPATPVAAEPVSFIGSASCTNCHQQETSAWQGSHHDLAMQAVSAATVLGNFDNQSIEYHGLQTQFLREGDLYVIETEDVAGDPERFEIAYVFGADPLQQYLVEFPGGRIQVLPYAWDSRPADAGGQRWFHLYPDEAITPDDELHWTGRRQNWNYQCAECHSTNLQVGYDMRSDTFDTTYSEIDVACEACHGPGSKHVTLAESGALENGNGLVTNLASRHDSTWVMNVETGIAALSETGSTNRQQAESCGRCHSRRGIITAEYEYGQPLLDTHRLALLNDPLYYDDGQIRDEVYVYGSFLQSRMHAAGVTCADCHDPHSLELVTGNNPNDVCAQCHLPTKFAVPEHAGHSTDTAGCVDCHMPETPYMVVDPRRDHSFRIPRPDLSVQTNAPNACQGCHEDVASMDAPDSHFATAFAAARAGHANTELLRVITDEKFSTIVRATAVSLLSTPLSSDSEAAIESALADDNALMRMAGVQVMAMLPQSKQLQFRSLLTDPVRAVRIDAARVLAPLSDQLPSTAGFDSAAAEFRAAQESVASLPEARVALADFALSQGDFETAIEGYQSALAIEPRSSLARINYVDALRALGDDMSGLALLRQGLELDATDPNLHYSLGLLLVRTDRSSLAVTALAEAARLAPDNARYLYVYAIALNSEGRREESAAVLQDGHQRFPRDYDIGVALATLHRDNGDSVAARDVLENLQAVFGDDPGLAAIEQSLQSP